MRDSTCTCPIRPNMTKREIYDEIIIPEKYCTSLKQASFKGWQCSNLHRELDRAIADERYLTQKKRKLIREGLTPHEAKTVLSTSKARSKVINGIPTLRENGITLEDLWKM